MPAAIRIPFGVGPTGRIGRADEDYDVANQYLKNLLLTRISERIMRPTYGSRVRDQVFERIDELLYQEIEGDIRDAVREWEPAISIYKIDLDNTESTLEIDILYTLSSTLGLPPQTLSVSIDTSGTVEETS